MTKLDIQLPIDSDGRGGLFIAKRTGDQEVKAFHLTGQQLDKVLDSIPDAIGIVRGLVDIARIRAEAQGSVDIIEAETDKIVQTTRVEIDRIRQTGEHIRTRGEVVSRIIRDFTGALSSLPDFDSQARLALIESLRDVLKLAVDGDSSR